MNPGFTPTIRKNVRINNPEPNSSTNPSATSLATSNERNRPLPDPPPCPADFSVSIKLIRDASAAGANPNSTPAASEIASAYPNTVKFSPADSTSTSDFGRSANNPAVHHHPSKIPAAPPKNESSKLSVKSCRNNLPRVAPSAERSATSRLRIPARDNSRFATFAQAINSTNPTPPNKRQQRRPDFSRSHRLQRLDFKILSLLRIHHVFLTQLPGDRVHLFARRRNRRVRTQPPQHAQDNSNPADRAPTSRRNGVQTCTSVGTSNPAGNINRKFSGITPITVAAFPSSLTVCPTISAFAPNRRLHNPSLKITIGAAPCTLSCATNSRPIAGCTPTIVRKLSVTNPSLICSGSPVARHRRPPHPDSAHVCQQSRARPHIRHIRPRKRRAPTAPALVMSVQISTKAIRRGIRQRPQNHRIQHAENRRIRANPQRQSKNRHSRKSRILPQHPQPITNVLPQILNPIHPPRVAAFLRQSRHRHQIPRSAARRASTGVIPAAIFASICRANEIAVSSLSSASASALRKSDRTRNPQLIDPAHESASRTQLVFKTNPIAADNLSQFASSLCKYFRPARVNE